MDCRLKRNVDSRKLFPPTFFFRPLAKFVAREKGALQYTKYILQEIEEGFKNGFNNSHILQPFTSNLPPPNPSIVTDCLAKKLFLNRM